jgi:hypothetical protein
VSESKAWKDWTSVKEYNKPGARGTQAYAAASEIQKYLTSNAAADYVDSTVEADGIHVTLHKGMRGRCRGWLSRSSCITRTSRRGLIC